ARTGPAVPLAAVDERGTTPALHRIRRGRVERVPVRLGLRDDVAERVIVESGVAAGDTVLLGSAQGLTEGTEVRVRRDPVGAAGGAGGAAAARDRDTTGR
ncbi:MAG TPA: hypothetical protein VNK43_11945, partial [Gemmatimonadales bacterium]|nr:hypothetical protein [Gemmatimonadales bacterium]